MTRIFRLLPQPAAAPAERPANVVPFRRPQRSSGQRPDLVALSAESESMTPCERLLLIYAVRDTPLSDVEADALGRACLGPINGETP